MSNKKTIQRKGIVKFDPETAKTLPISTNRKRTKGWAVKRKDNGLTLSITAFESLNMYDFIALFQMLDDYSKNKKEWQFKAKMQIDNETERILMYRKFDLKELCKQRGILTKKINRKSIAESFKRWYQAELTYQYDGDEPIHTRYIFEFKVDKDYNYIEIVANTNFLNLCLENGMAMNWERLSKYGKSYYTIALDIYLQFRAIAYGKKNKRYKYPDVIKEETLFHHTGIGDEVKEIREKRRKLKRAFEKFKEVTGQKYIYDKNERKWIKESYLNYINEKNKK